MRTPWPNLITHRHLRRLPPLLSRCTAQASQTLNKILLCHLCPSSNSTWRQQKHLIPHLLLLCLQLLLFHLLLERVVPILLLHPHHQHQESQRCLPAASRHLLAPNQYLTLPKSLARSRTSRSSSATCARLMAVARSSPVPRTCGPTRLPTRAPSPFPATTPGANPSLQECTI